MKKNDETSGFALSKENYILIAIGAAIILIGYALMLGGGTDDPKVFNADTLFSFRRITLAPIMIVFGFIFEIYAIMKKPKSGSQK